MIIYSPVLYASRRRRVSSNDPIVDSPLLFIAAIFGPVFLLGAIIFGVAAWQKTTDKVTSYEVDVKPYATYLGSTGHKNTRRTNIVFVKMLAPNGVSTTLPTGFNSKECPIIDYSALKLKVIVTSNKNTGKLRHFDTQLIGNPCRNKS